MTGRIELPEGVSMHDTGWRESLRGSRREGQAKEHPPINDHRLWHEGHAEARLSLVFALCTLQIPHWSLLGRDISGSKMSNVIGLD